MAQELRREQMVRLPNPSAQPFVAALKTARFFAVLFFWVTMVCVLAHLATFVLTEWAGLYDVSAPPAAPVAPAGPAVPAPAEEKAPAAPAQGPGFFETTAMAAEPGELFPNVPMEGRSEKAPKAKAEEPKAAPGAPEAPAPPEEPVPSVEGTIVGEPEAPVTPAVPLTPEQVRLRANHYRDVTAGILGPARIIGVLASLLLGVTLFIYLQIALLGRLAGIRHLTQALFILLLFLVTVVPWENVFQGFQTTAMFGFEDLLEAHALRTRGVVADGWAQGLYFGRFLAMPLLSALLLAWAGIQFAVGYGDSVLANE
jgi:hypothetical protein